MNRSRFGACVRGLLALLLLVAWNAVATESVDPPTVDDTGEPTPAPVTIESMSLRSGVSTYGFAGNFITLLNRADTYFLSDGSSWRGSSSSYYYARFAELDRVEVDGGRVRYVFVPREEGEIYRQSDYYLRRHAAAGVLAVEGDMATRHIR